MVKEARLNIVTQCVTGKRVRTEVVKYQPKSAEELKIEANERRIEEKRRIERKKQRIEQEKQKEKGVPKKVAGKVWGPIIPIKFSLACANDAIYDMEKDLGRKLTKEEKKKIKQDFRD